MARPVSLDKFATKVELEKLKKDLIKLIKLSVKESIAKSDKPTKKRKSAIK